MKAVPKRMLSKPADMYRLLLLLSLTFAWASAYYHQYTFLEPVRDEYGNEITKKRVLELTALKSTMLGYGLGFNYTYFLSTPPFVSHLPPLPHRRRFKRQTISAPFHMRPRHSISLLGHPSPLGGSLSIYDALIPAPVTGFKRRPKKCSPSQRIKCNPHSPYRTVDGLCNNLEKPKWGAAMQPFQRLHKAYYYYDGLDIPRLTSAEDPRRLLPSARLVSRLIHEPDRKGQKIPELTNLIQQWGQFIDHDITGTPAHKAADGTELECCRNAFLSEERQLHNDIFNGGPCHPIYIPPLDRHFRYSCMSFARSQAHPRKKDCYRNAPLEPREQINMLTAFLDASQVYGSSLKDNKELRLFKHGMLRVTEYDLLPEDVNSTCVREGAYCFNAGDSRVNEHPALSSVHTVFHRLHNRWALQFLKINPHWSDEKIFQEVRKIMGAVMQHVTYHDWLPIILGPDVMREHGLSVVGAFDYSTSAPRWHYDPLANPTVFNSFAAAAFRFGHTLIPSDFTVGVGRFGRQIKIHEMFNRPKFIQQEPGQSISNFCSGLLEDNVQHFDRFISASLVDRLFEDKDNISMDLAALNIQRARDHGLPGYNEFREVCGFPRIKSFQHLYRDDPDRAEVFRRVYDHVDDIDLFTGGVSERPLAGAVIGPTFACILGKQFRNLKFGDRYWYESRDPKLAFTKDQIQEIRKFNMAKVMCTMAPLQKTIVNPFFKNGAFLPKPIILADGEKITQNRYVDCSRLYDINLSLWFDNTKHRRG